MLIVEELKLLVGSYKTLWNIDTSVNVDYGGKGFGLSCEGAQNENDRRLRIKFN